MMSKRIQETIRKVPNGAIVTSVLSKLGLLQGRVSEEELEELVSTGLIALVKAESTYTYSSSSVSRASHAYGKIRWAILDYRRKPKGFYGRVVSMRLRSMKRVANRLSHKNFCRPTRKEIADQMGLSQDQVDALVLAEASIYSVDEIDTLASRNGEDTILGPLERESEMHHLQGEIAKLNSVEREIIHLYYIKGLPSYKIAQKLSYSLKHLLNLKALTVRKLRLAMRK
jgi:DNA-directed RNA polymerase specialized sigma subunit